MAFRERRRRDSVLEVGALAGVSGQLHYVQARFAGIGVGAG
jgi:hypothetical protein